jgi:ABC-type phosphate/phosphonate transport system permease subunit
MSNQTLGRTAAAATPLLGLWQQSLGDPSAQNWERLVLAATPLSLKGIDLKLTDSSLKRLGWKPLVLDNISSVGPVPLEELPKMSIACARAYQNTSHPLTVNALYVKGLLDLDVSRQPKPSEEVSQALVPFALNMSRLAEAMSDQQKQIVIKTIATTRWGSWFQCILALALGLLLINQLKPKRNAIQANRCLFAAMRLRPIQAVAHTVRALRPAAARRPQAAAAARITPDHDTSDTPEWLIQAGRVVDALPHPAGESLFDSNLTEAGRVWATLSRAPQLQEENERLNSELEKLQQRDAAGAVGARTLRSELQAVEDALRMKRQELSHMDDLYLELMQENAKEIQQLKADMKEAERASASRRETSQAEITRLRLEAQEAKQAYEDFRKASDAAHQARVLQQTRLEKGPARLGRMDVRRRTPAVVDAQSPLGSGQAAVPDDETRRIEEKLRLAGAAVPPPPQMKGVRAAATLD